MAGMEAACCSVGAPVPVGAPTLGVVGVEVREEVREEVSAGEPKTRASRTSNRLRATRGDASCTDRKK